MTAIIAAATGSHNLDADTKAGEKYFKHQLKMLWPKINEKKRLELFIFMSIRLRKEQLAQ